MQTSNTEEMVTISRAEYERFQEQAQVITGLTLQNEWLLEQLKLSKKAVRPFFGAGGADGHGAAELYLQRSGSLCLWNQSRRGEACCCEGARAQAAVRQCAGCRSGGIKQTLEVRTFDGQRVPVMAYIMNPELHLKPSLPPRTTISVSKRATSRTVCRLAASNMRSRTASRNAAWNRIQRKCRPSRRSKGRPAMNDNAIQRIQAGDLRGMSDRGRADPARLRR